MEFLIYWRADRSGCFGITDMMNDMKSVYAMKLNEGKTLKDKIAKLIKLSLFFNIEISKFI